MNSDALIKLVLVGNASVGKSSILLRYADDSFTESYIATIGVDFKIKTVEVDGKTVKLQMWDTAGQERFRTITSSYYRGSQLILLVYDITDSQSFQDITKTWSGEVDGYASEKVITMLVGTKCDLTGQRQVTTEDGKGLAAKLGISFFEVSAKSGTGVEDLFTQAARECLKEGGNGNEVARRAPAAVRPEPTSPAKDTKPKSPEKTTDNAAVGERVIKLLLAGNSTVGKSSVLLRYADNSFSESFIATIGIDFKTKFVNVDGKNVKLQMQSFNDIESTWTREVERYAASDVIRILAGNKTDLTDKRQVSTEQGKELADKLGIPFFEVSAKTGDGVENLFMSAAKGYLQRITDPSDNGTQRQAPAAPASPTPAPPIAPSSSQKRSSPAKAVESTNQNSSSDESSASRMKVILVGDSGVGKSAALTRYSNDTFEEKAVPTIGVDFMSKTVEVDKTSLRMQLWDTAGQERFRSISSAYYKGSNCVVIVYDVTNVYSFNAVSDTWLPQVEQFATDDVIRVLVGCKCDGLREVRKERGQELASRLGMTFHEISAKTGEGIKELFADVARQFIAKNPQMASKTQSAIDHPPRARRSAMCALL